jgi:putative PIN family toxin of toxin-antitoxin system
VRILLDVNVLVRANEVSSGPARTLLRALIARGHTLLLSSEMLVELARVLRYPRIQALFGLTEEQIYEYVQYLTSASEIVPIDHSLFAPMRDPMDIAVLQTAIAGAADVICTRDSDFRDAETVAFCAAAGIEICTDRELQEKLGI